MKRTISIATITLALFCFDAIAQRKSCEDLKSEIATKLDAKGVKNYELKIVAPDEIKGESVVGSCDAGAKRITYVRK